MSLFSFLEPSFADIAEGFKESGRCDGLLSGRCAVVVVGRFLTVGGLLAMKVSLMSKFKCEFNDNSGLFAGEFCKLKDEVGLIFFVQNIVFFKFLFINKRCYAR